MPAWKSDCSRLVGTTSWKDPQDQDGHYVVLLREENTPITNPQSENLALGSLETPDIPLLTRRQPLKRHRNPLAGAAVQACNVFERPVRPTDLERQDSPRRRRRASSWDTTRPSITSFSASARATSSSAVKGSSSTGASLKDQQGATSSAARSSRNRKASCNSLSGKVSTKAWRRSRSRITNPILPSIPVKDNIFPGGGSSSRGKLQAGSLFQVMRIIRP